VLARLDTTPQRRPTLAPRYSNMSNNTRYLAVAAVLAVAVIVGFAMLSGRDVGDSDGSPTPDPRPSTAATNPPSAAPQALQPGTHTTSVFQPPATFTVPEGWRMTAETPAHLRLEPVLEVDAQLDVCRGEPTAVDNTNSPVAGVGNTAQEILEAVAERTDLEVISEPRPWSETSSGLQGSWVEVRNPGDAELVVLGPDCGNNLFPGGHNRIGILDLPDGTKILMTIFTFEGTEAFIEVATPIAESMEFDIR
jgi:hypothetical protein